MQNNTHYALWAHEEHKGGDCGSAKRDGYQKGPIGGYGRGHGCDQGYSGGGGIPSLVSIVDKLVMYQGFVPNHMFFVHSNIVLNMSQRNVLT
jgi:hypothetical protein